MQNSKCHLSCENVRDCLASKSECLITCMVDGHIRTESVDCPYANELEIKRLSEYIRNAPITPATNPTIQKGSASTYQCLLPCRYNKEHSGRGYCTLIEKSKEPGKDTCCLSDPDSPFLFDEQTYNLIRNGGISMTNESNIERHRDVCRELNALYDRKNRDYGDSFHESWKDYGITMAAIRLGNKYNRLKNLTSGKMVQNVADETVRDTLLDLANYAIMTVMELDAESEPPKYEWQKEG